MIQLVVFLIVTNVLWFVVNQRINHIWFERVEAIEREYDSRWRNLSRDIAYLKGDIRMLKKEMKGEENV